MKGTMTMKMDLNLGKGIVFNVDLDALDKHDDVRRYYAAKGLNNILGDTHADVAIKDYPDTDEGREACKQAALALVTKKYEAMLAGTARSNDRTRTSALDPKARLRAALLELVKGKPLGKAIAKLKGDERTALVDKAIAANADKVEAHAIVMDKRKAEAAALGSELDLDSLAI